MLPGFASGAAARQVQNVLENIDIDHLELAESDSWKTEDFD